MSARAKKTVKPHLSRSDSSASARRYREKMRRQGMRLVQFWAPDVSAPGFTKEARRQSRLASRAEAHEKEILEEIESLSSEIDLGGVPDFVMPGGKTG